MELTLEEYGKYLGDETLTDELALEKYRQEKEKYNNEVNKIVGGYKGLDMDEFIDRIGGQEKIETMNKINEKLDRSYLVNGTLVPKREGNKKLKELINLSTYPLIYFNKIYPRPLRDTSRTGELESRVRLCVV